MNRDRGTIKWTAMMLPEHVSMLRELQYQQTKEPKPAIDEQKIEEYEYIICEAMEFNAELYFKYWKNGFFEEFRGSVHYIDHVTKRLTVINNKGDVDYIPINCICSII